MSAASTAARSAAVAAAMFVAACRAAPMPPDDFGGPGDVPDAPSAADAAPSAETDARVPPIAPPIAPPGLPFRLTDGGCCVRPFWRADSRALWFIDRPADGAAGPAATGIYEARLDAPLTAPTLLTTTVAAFSPDQRWRIDLSSGRTALVRLADGASFEVPALGRSVVFSPDGARIAWQADNPNADFERQMARIMVAAPDGTGAREVARLARGSLVDWLGADALLVRARAAADSDVDRLMAQPVEGGQPREILRAKRLRGMALSADRRWMAYTVTASTEPGANGLWLAATDGASPPRRLDDLFGAYRWRDAHRLLIVPFDIGAPSHRLVELDADSGAVRPLTDPAAQAFRIGNGDWTVSPDGRHVAFVSAADRNVWVMALGE